MQTYYENTTMYRKASSQCGGTLIRPNVVLTAAHCITDVFEDILNHYVPYAPNAEYPTLESTFDIYAGLFDISVLKSPNPPSPVVRSKVIKIIEVFTKLFAKSL